MKRRFEQKSIQVTTVCIIRHGETEWNKERKFQGREDIELNDEGKRQASTIAAHLGRFSWDVIITSPLKRALATAETVRRALKNTPLVIQEAFIERDFGRASGLTSREQERAFTDGVVPGKESDDALAKRVLEGLQCIIRDYRNRKVILITHGAVINSLLKAVSAGKINVGETNIKNACFTVIEHDGSGWQVRTYNSMNYLSGRQAAENAGEFQVMEPGL